MALIKCTECGREISDKAESCVGCGCPVGKMHENKVDKEKYSELEIKPNRIENDIKDLEDYLDIKTAVIKAENENYNGMNSTEMNINSNQSVQTKNKNHIKRISIVAISALVLTFCLVGLYIKIDYAYAKDINDVSKDIERMYRHGYEPTYVDLFYWSLGDEATGEKMFEYCENNNIIFLTLLNLANAGKYEDMAKLGVKMSQPERDLENFKNATFENARTSISANFDNIILENGEVRGPEGEVVFDDKENAWEFSMLGPNSMYIRATKDFWNELENPEDSLNDISENVFASKDDDFEEECKDIVENMQNDEYWKYR